VVPRSALCDKFTDKIVKCGFENGSLRQIFQLKQKLKNYEWHTQTIKSYELEIERIFVETDGLLLLTAPWIGHITAAEIYCEMGDLSQFTMQLLTFRKSCNQGKCI
jgi:transposase